jgi:hypothetical protein
MFVLRAADFDSDRLPKSTTHAGSGAVQLMTQNKNAMKPREAKNVCYAGACIHFQLESQVAS